MMLHMTYHRYSGVLRLQLAIISPPATTNAVFGL